MSSTMLLLLLLLSLSARPAESHSHWVVTEEGKIQAQVREKETKTIVVGGGC